MTTTTQRGVRKKRDGLVISDAMDKTIVVRVERRFRHPVYGKEITRYTKLYAHDEKSEAKKGDVVRVVEARPLSRLKRWRLLEVLKSGRAQASGSTHDSA